MPFETLDTTSRRLTCHRDVDILLSDTVGFIRKLPKRLLASFESTLAEVLEATLLVIVVDVADSECTLHLQTTEEMLVKLQADNIPRLYVFNKTDKLTTTPSQAHFYSLSYDHEFMVLSSHDCAAITRLKQALINAVIGKQDLGYVYVPYKAGHFMTMVYAKCKVIEAKPLDNGLNFTIEGECAVIEQIQRKCEEV